MSSAPSKHKLTILQIAPNRVVSAYSTGLDVKFLCAPLCVRQDVETTVTWTIYEEKGDVKLLCWTQRGVDSSTHTIQLAPKSTVIKSILPIDDTGDTIFVNFDNSRVESYRLGESEALSTWQIPTKTTYLKIFKANECSLTEKYNGSILLVLAERAHFHSISSSGQVSDSILSVTLPDVPIHFVQTNFRRRKQGPQCLTYENRLSFNCQVKT